MVHCISYRTSQMLIIQKMYKIALPWLCEIQKTSTANVYSKHPLNFSKNFSGQIKYTKIIWRCVSVLLSEMKHNNAFTKRHDSRKCGQITRMSRVINKKKTIFYHVCALVAVFWCMFSVYEKQNAADKQMKKQNILQSKCFCYAVLVCIQKRNYRGESLQQHFCITYVDKCHK